MLEIALPVILLSTAAFAQAPVETASSSHEPDRHVALTIGGASAVGLLSGEVELAVHPSLSFFAGGYGLAWRNVADYAGLVAGARLHPTSRGLDGAYLEAHAGTLLFGERAFGPNWYPMLGVGAGYTWVWGSGFTLSVGASMDALITNSSFLPVVPLPGGRLALGYSF